MDTATILRNGYDAFLSHSHADKTWVHALAHRLAAVDYNGRPLRPWLDEQVLDPGDLGQEAELTSALDRSRTLVLILSPASVASRWVGFEVEYFLRHRSIDDVLLVLKDPCSIPPVLDKATLFDFTGADTFERTFEALVARLCPPAGIDAAEVDAEVDRAWDAAAAADPGGFDASPTAERDALLETLLRFPIDDAPTEGLAIASVVRAARLLVRDEEQRHPAAYNMRMVLGECLAVGMHRSPRYRLVAQRLLDMEPAATAASAMAFVVMRAYSKLAEIEPALVEPGALLRVAARLDATPPYAGVNAATAMLIGRVAAKLRGSDLGDLLIQILSEGGAASRIAAIGAISTSGSRSGPVYYTTALAARHDVAQADRNEASEPPSRKLLALLSGIDAGQPSVVRQQLELARDDLRRAFGIDDIPYGYTWFALRRAPAATGLHVVPFMGTVAKATATNMEALALSVTASHVVCLTEPRIVDALFERAGALLIPLQDEDSTQCRRLAGRGVPFAMLDDERMRALEDGDQIAIEPHVTRVVVRGPARSGAR